MLSAKDNELLTRTGAGILLGDLFRRFWPPALLLDELPATVRPPVRFRILGEQVVAIGAAAEFQTLSAAEATPVSAI